MRHIYLFLLLMVAATASGQTVAQELQADPDRAAAVMVNVKWFLALGGWCVLGHLVDGKGIEITRCTIRIGLEFQGDSLSRYRGSHHQQYE